MRVSVGGMAEAAYGLSMLERIRDEKLGDYAVLFAGPWKMAQLREVVTFCRKHALRFVMVRLRVMDGVTGECLRDARSSTGARRLEHSLSACHDVMILLANPVKFL